MSSAERTVHLSVTEQKVYAELFKLLDKEQSGKLSQMLMADLFAHSDLSSTTLQKILELSGAKRLGYFGRTQVYIALKLIALAQHNLDLSSTTLAALYQQAATNTEKDMTMLPKFKTDRIGDRQLPLAFTRATDIRGKPLTSQLPSPTSQPLLNSPSDINHHQVLQSSSRSPPLAPPQQYAVPAPPPTHHHHTSIHYPSGPAHPTWTMFDKLDDGEEHSSVVSSYLEHYVDPKQQFDTISMMSNLSLSSTVSSGGAGGDDEDVFAITLEQMNYYSEQFSHLQPDPAGVVSGAIAKEFFQMSGLPLEELSKIWQLSDVNRDGALSKDEFLICMHLVVLRRNEIDIPDLLPPSLTKLVEDELYSDMCSLNTPTPEPCDTPLNTSSTSQQLVLSKPGVPGSGNEWMRFRESPGAMSSVSSVSGGVKPVKFLSDYSQPPDPENKIIHPVPLRAQANTTPSFARDTDPSHLALDDEGEETRYHTDSVVTVVSAACVTSHQHDIPSPLTGDLLGIGDVGVVRLAQQQPRRAATLPSGPAAQQEIMRQLKLEEAKSRSSSHRAAPPPPPQRVVRHSRSSSLDLSKMRADDELSSQLTSPPAVPPRVTSPHANQAHNGANFADFSSHFIKTKSESPPLIQLDSGGTDSVCLPFKTTSQLEESGVDPVECAKRYKISNQQLERLNEHLEDEVASLLEQRTALEVELEQLISYKVH